MTRHRCEMVKLAIQGNDKFTISLFEVRREQTSYTFETLREMQRIYPDAKLYFIPWAWTLCLILTTGTVRTLYAGKRSYLRLSAII